MDSWKMNNIKTTIGGILAAIGIAGSQVPQVPEEYRWIFALLGAAGTGLIGLTAKDYNVHSTANEVQTATVEKDIEKQESEKKK
jgi:hypothetical protein